MSGADVKFAFGLRPEKALEFLRSKYAVLNDVDDVAMLNSVRGKAARIANLSSLEMTKDIYQSLIDAHENGIAFGQWKKEMLAHFKRKGWVAYYDKGYQLADPKTGEHFGTPWRLNTIYRTNTQSAYSAQRYQQQRDNADSRPYWQYTAVNDNRTRPSHSAMNGLVYRYDDPFWDTFYPPNGFNCRCSVIALAPRDIARDNLIVRNGEDDLVEHTRQVNATTREQTTAFKVSDDHYVMADRGFDRNIGRTVYRPNLDLYPEALAHQFAKREMGGKAFQLNYAQFEQELVEQKAKLGIKDKANAEQMVAIRNHLRQEYMFAAGIISQEKRNVLGIKKGTVWLSDDTLIKQFNSRLGDPNFTLEQYAVLPDVINQPDDLFKDKNNNLIFIKRIDNRKYIVVIKYVSKKKELFLTSMRGIGQAEIDKLAKKWTVIR
ncbi:minor capsid protein [Pasteurellaceae bacterium HPA106]|uniref:phage minor head protein n=1 Tax=Spirabiliibacterium pneumoniae TaxID=221400 RepID=UPI001AAD38B2|nr:phage minor head protein [Spirabiliibacterium pneumoniae]MBE2895464.1 minor capsid protein [Spirabiliibacterium pneumoniae]